MGAFIKRHAVVILFVLGMVTFGFTYYRQETLIRENHHLTQRLEATVAERRQEICAAEADTRAAVRTVLLGIADDFVLNPTRRAALELRVHEALADVPKGCPVT